MTVDAGLLWAVLGGVIVGAVAWGKSQSDLRWIKDALVEITKRLSALEAKRVE